MLDAGNTFPMGETQKDQNGSYRVKNLPYIPDPQAPTFQPLGWETITVTEVILLFRSYFLLRTSIILFVGSFYLLLLNLLG